MLKKIAWRTDAFRGEKVLVRNLGIRFALKLVPSGDCILPLELQKLPLM